MSLRRSAALVMTLALTAIVLAARADGATINGSVVAQSDGKPLSGMTVAVYTVGGNAVTSARSGSSGLYSISVSAGEYRLVAWDGAGVFATSFYDGAPVFEASKVVTLGANSIVSADFRLVRNGWITGTVRADAGGSPLSSIVVAAYDANGYRRGTTTTGAGGEYTLALPPQTYRVAAWDDALDYAPQYYQEQPAFGAATEVSVDATETSGGIDFLLKKAASIAGVVRDRVSGAPLAGIVVEAWVGTERSAVATTGADGAFLLRVSPSALRLLAWDPAGVHATVFDGDAGSFGTTPVRSPAPGTSVTGIDLAMVRGGRVEGTVRSASDGAPLEGASVAAFNADGTVRGSITTGASGSYSILVPPGTYSIGAWDPALGYLEQFYTGAHVFSNAMPVAVATSGVTGGIDFMLVRAGKITGTVTAATSGAPLAGMRVFLYDSNGTESFVASTSASGRYVLAAEPGSYRLVVADPARVYATSYGEGAKNFDASTPMSIVAGGEIERDVELSVGAKVEGTVRDLSKSEPVSGVVVSAYDLAGNRIGSATSGDGGAFSLLVPGGTYRVVAVDPIWRYTRVWYEDAATFETAKTILIGPGIVRPMDFALPAHEIVRRRSVVRP